MDDLQVSNNSSKASSLSGQTQREAHHHHHRRNAPLHPSKKHHHATADSALAAELFVAYASYREEAMTPPAQLLVVVRSATLMWPFGR